MKNKNFMHMSKVKISYDIRINIVRTQILPSTTFFI